MEKDPVALCTEHLQEIGQALAAYARDHGELPGHLSDLSLEYVSDATVFHCPADASPGHPGPSWAPVDAKLPSSYLYEMSAEALRSDFLGIAVGLGPERLRPGATWRAAVWRWSLAAGRPRSRSTTSTHDSTDGAWRPVSRPCLSSTASRTA